MEVRKRKQRAILSCNDCRRRKLKCDRELPCNRCIGGGYPERCAYNSTEQEEPSPKRVKTGPLQNLAPATSSSPSVGPGERVEHLEHQLAEIQEVVRRLEHRWISTDGLRTRQGGSEATAEPYQSAPLVGLFKGKGMRTFYYGPSSPITIIANVWSYLIVYAHLPFLSSVT